MGTDSSFSGLDQELTRYGVKALRVADASALPVIPSGNIFSMVAGIAAAATDMILTYRE